MTGDYMPSGVPVPFLKRETSLIYICVAAAAIGTLAHLIEGFSAEILMDDAYYYIVTARNYAVSGIYTFDGLNITNGFHPLLFYLEVFFFRFTGLGPEPFETYKALIIIFALGLLLFLGIFMYSIRKMYRESEDNRAVCIALCLSLAGCFFYSHTVFVYNGMETVLSFPLAVFLIISVYRGQYGTGGVLGVLLVAARLDTLLYFLPVLALMYSLYEWRKQDSIAHAVRVLMKLLLPSVVFAVLFMVYNKVEFGHAMPISGAIKSSFPHPNPLISNLFGYDAVARHWYLAFKYRVFMAFCLALAGGWMLLRPGLSSTRTRFLGFSMVAVTVSQISALVFFQKWEGHVPTWYQLPILLSGLMSFAIGLAGLLQGRALRTFAAFCLLAALGVNTLLLVSSSYRTARTAGNTELVHNEFGEAMEFVKTTDSKALWATTDCGRISFWTGRRVINLDGLINSYEFQRVLADKGLRKYLHEAGVRYLLVHVWERDYFDDREFEAVFRHRPDPEAFSGDYSEHDYYLYSHLYDEFSDKIPLKKEWEIWRSRPFVEANSQAHYIVYDLKLAGIYKGS